LSVSVFRKPSADWFDILFDAPSLLTEGSRIINFGAVLQSSVVLLKALLPQMRVTLNAIDEFGCEIERRRRAHAEYQLFAALLCAGSVFASRLLSAPGTQRARFACAQDLR
jgi:hypothetical protein